MRYIEWYHFRWPWVTSNPVFKVMAFLKSIISNLLGTKLLLNTIGNQCIEWYHFQWFWVISDQGFKVTTFSDIEYLRNDTRYSHSYYRTSIGSHMCSIEWWHFQWLRRTSNPIFKVTAILKSNIPKTVCLGTNLL